MEKSYNPTDSDEERLLNELNSIDVTITESETTEVSQGIF